MLDNIKKILNPYYAEDCAGNVFDLREDAIGVKGEIARFRNNSGRVLAYKFDKKREKADNTIFPFFANNVTDLKKMCDFILFYENKTGENFVLLCNLKSDAKGTDNKQMEAAAVFVDFIEKTLQRLYGNTQVFKQKKRLHFSSNKERMHKNATSSSKKSENLQQQAEFWFHTFGTQLERCNLDQICR